MRIYFVIVLIFLIIGCKSEKRENRESENSMIGQLAGYNFATKTDSIYQTLSCKLIDSTKLEFHLNSKNLITNTQFQLQGIATKVIYEFDGETESDEEGNGYFVDEYKMKNKNCEYVISLNSEEHQMAKIQSNCKFNNLISKSMRPYNASR
jgi:hypothetical protein